MEPSKEARAMFDQPGEKELALAFAAESRAGARAEACALKAQRQERGAVAALWRAVAQGHRVAARRLLMLLRGKIGEGAENLRAAREQELPARLRALDQWAPEVRRGLGGPATALEQAARAARRQAELMEELAQNPGARPDYHVCQICGCPLAPPLPANCPVCGAVAAKLAPAEPPA
jgi:rubrerythrin